MTQHGILGHPPWTGAEPRAPTCSQKAPPPQLGTLICLLRPGLASSTPVPGTPAPAEPETPAADGFGAPARGPGTLSWNARELGGRSRQAVGCEFFREQKDKRRKL